VNIYLAGGALALLLWPKKAAANPPGSFEGPDIDPATGSAVGTFAPKGDVVDVGDDFNVQYFPARRYQP